MDVRLNSFLRFVSLKVILLTSRDESDTWRIARHVISVDAPAPACRANRNPIDLV